MGAGFPGGVPSHIRLRTQRPATLTGLGAHHAVQAAGPRFISRCVVGVPFRRGAHPRRCIRVILSNGGCAAPVLVIMTVARRRVLRRRWPGGGRRTGAGQCAGRQRCRRGGRRRRPGSDRGCCARQPATAPAVMLQFPPTSTGIRPAAIAWLVAPATSRHARTTASRLRARGCAASAVNTCGVRSPASDTSQPAWRSRSGKPAARSAVGSVLSALAIGGRDRHQDRPQRTCDRTRRILHSVTCRGEAGVWLSWMLRSADWRRIHVHRCQSCRRRFADDEPGCIPPGEERFPQLCRCDLGPDLGRTNCRGSGPYCPACAARITEEQREIDEWEREWLLTGPSASPRLACRPRTQTARRRSGRSCTCHQCRGNNRNPQPRHGLFVAYGTAARYVLPSRSAAFAAGRPARLGIPFAWTDPPGT